MRDDDGANIGELIGFLLAAIVALILSRFFG